MAHSGCNSTLSETHWDTDTIAGNFTLHTLGWLICGACAIIATLISLFLIYRHAGHYTKPNEQRHIIRILLMVPIYAITSWLSYVWYWHAIYWEVARDCYEAFAIAGFFALLCNYISPTLREQKNFFSTLTVRPWPWPCRKMKKPRSGLTWFNIIWIGIFQYVFVRVACTIIATATQATGLYCEESLHPRWAHLWTMLFNMIAVTIAMYCLIAFYLNLKKPLTPNKPFFKLLCIKLVIFFSFWQMILLDFLTSANVIKPTRYMSLGDISVGFNSLLICFEMIIFAILHLFAFTWKDYDQGPTKTTPVMSSLLDAFNPWDIIRATARGTRWLICGMSRRHHDAEKILERQKSEEASGLVGNAASFAGRRDSSPPPGQDGGLLVHHPLPMDGKEQVNNTLKVQTSEHAGYHPEPVEMHSSPLPGRQRPHAPLSPYSNQVASSGYGNAIPPPPHQYHERYRDQTPSPVDRVGGGGLAYPTISYMPSIPSYQQQRRPSDAGFREQHESLMGGSPSSPVEYLHSPVSPMVGGQRPYQAYSGAAGQGSGQTGAPKKGGGYSSPALHGDGGQAGLARNGGMI